MVFHMPQLILKRYNHMKQSYQIPYNYFRRNTLFQLTKLKALLQQASTQSFKLFRIFLKYFDNLKLTKQDNTMLEA